MSGKLKYILPPAIIGISLLVAMVIVASKPDVKPVSPAVKPRLIRVVQVKQETIQMSLKSQGIVMPRTESSLVSQVAGLIETVSPSFGVGGFFEKGDVLVQLDASDYKFSVIRAKQQVALTELSLQLEQQQGRIAREEWQQLNEGEVPPLVARTPQLAREQAAFEAAKATLEQAELNLERTRIRAPFAGRIRGKNVDVGQYVTPGMALAQVYAIDYAEVRLPLPDDQLAFLEMAFDFRGGASSKRGPGVLLKANFAGKQQTWQAYLTRIEAEVDDRSRMVHVVARMENPYGQTADSNQPPLAVGLFVQAEIEGRSYDEIFRIPRGAIRAGNQLLVVDDQNRLFARAVDVLRFDGEHAFVAKNLHDGELICISNLDTFVDGMLVKPIHEQEN